MGVRLSPLSPIGVLMTDAATLPAKRPNGAPIGNKNASRLGPKVRAALAHLVAHPEDTIKAACAAVGCGERTFYDAQHSEAFAEHLRLLARGRIKTTILTKALARYESLVGAESEYVAADISKDVLGQAGVRDRLDSAPRPAATGGIRISFVTVGAQGEQSAVRVEIGGNPQDMVSTEANQAPNMNDDAK